MKKALLFLVLLFSCSSVLISQEQHTFSSKEDYFQDWYVKTSGGTPVSHTHPEHSVGSTVSGGSVYEYRTILYWEWTYGEIPTEAEVQNVTIKFKARKGYNDSFHFSFHNIAHYKFEPGINFYNECVSGNKIYENTLQPDQNLNILFNMTFNSQSPVGGGWEIWDAVKNVVQSGNYYFTLGVRELGSLVAPNWNLYPYGGSISDIPAVDLIITYATPNQSFQFINKIESSENYGSLILNENKSNPIPSGTPTFVPWGTQNAVRTNELPFIPNWAGTGVTKKDNYWDISGSNNYQLNHSFTSNTQEVHIMKATFQTTVPTTLSANLLEGGSGGTIQLKDPWYYYKDANNNWYQSNEFKSYSSPFNIQNNSIGTYGGVFLNQGLPNWTPPYYSVRAPLTQSIYLSQTGKTHKFYFQNWSGTGAAFQNANALETGMVFTSGSTVVNANLKGTQLSNDLNAYANNSQRKFIRTPDGVLHQVYSSLGRIWYEQSTDGGTTWILANQGKPIDSGQGKLPSVDYVTIQSNPEIYQVVIVYQEQYSTGFRIKAKSFQKNSGGEYFNYFDEVVIATYLSESYSNNANPVIAVDIAGDITYVWEQKSGTAGLYCRTGHTSIYDLSLYGSSNVRLTSTTSASKNPTIAVVKAGLTGVKHIAWEENYQIKYSTLNGTTIGTIEIPSSSSYLNFKPSITIRYAAPPSSPYPALVWLIEEQQNYQKRVQLRIKFSSGSWSQYWSWYYPGSANVNSANINSNTEGKFVISWGGDSNDQYMTSLTSSVVYNLSTRGDVQVSNAESVMGNMKIMSFDKISAVHDFTQTAVTQGLYKGTGNEIVSKGFILSNNNDFYVFDFGAIEADGNRIFFGDSFEEPDPSIKNNKIETESFYLSDNSIFNFKADYFSSNSKQDASPAKFKLQLIDANSGEPLSLLKEEGNVNTSYNNQGFAVNLNGLGDKEVKLQLIFDAEGFSSEVYTKTVRDSSQINKGHYQQISYDGEETVKDYGLSQNYPNPFNPNTIIKYQLPQDGFVTLKIYDALGREVNTLVNEYKTTGRYEVNFDASKLASGVYIYSIKSGNFTASKKMILTK